jgi:hypothetical protein
MEFAIYLTTLMVSQDYTDLNSMLTENDELLGILKEAVGA